MMVRFLSLRRSDQPYLGELDFHSWPVTPCSAASHSTSSSHASADGPSAAETSLGVGCAALPTNAFGVSMVFLSGVQDAGGTGIRGSLHCLRTCVRSLPMRPFGPATKGSERAFQLRSASGASPAFGLG